MIHLLPFSKLISGAAIINGIVVTLIFWSYSNLTFNQIIRIALVGATVIDIVLFVLLYFGWEWLWEKFPKLNHLLFPNLNGTWKIKIHWKGIESDGEVNGLAYIKQDFLQISMEVDTANSESETLCTKSFKDPASGRPILYYMYRVIPNNTTSNNTEAYEGSAILKLDHRCSNSLKGNYYTSRQTTGFFELLKEKKE